MGGRHGNQHHSCFSCLGWRSGEQCTAAPQEPVKRKAGRDWRKKVVVVRERAGGGKACVIVNLSTVPNFIDPSQLIVPLFPIMLHVPAAVVLVFENYFRVLPQPLPLTLPHLLSCLHPAAVTELPCAATKCSHLPWAAAPRFTSSIKDVTHLFPSSPAPLPL